MKLIEIQTGEAEIDNVITAVHKLFGPVDQFINEQAVRDHELNMKMLDILGGIGAASPEQLQTTITTVVDRVQKGDTERTVAVCTMFERVTAEAVKIPLADIESRGKRLDLPVDVRELQAQRDQFRDQVRELINRVSELETQVREHKNLGGTGYAEPDQS